MVLYVAGMPACRLCCAQSDATIDITHRSRASQEYSTILQLVWLLIAMQCSSLVYSLDFLHCLVMLSLQWCSFLAGTLVQV